MTDWTLWRIEAVPEDTQANERLREGLRLHVAHSPLTTIAMRIGAQQRQYLALEGCPGCMADRCRPGCPAALFRRLFAACGGEVRPVAPPQGLARRPYIRGVFAWPNAQSTPFPGALDQWRDARLLVHWRRFGAQICGSALMLATDEGPDPATELRAHAWRTLTLPTAMVARWSNQKTPGLPFGSAWLEPLFLLLPHEPHEAVVDSEQGHMSAPTRRSELE